MSAEARLRVPERSQVAANGLANGLGHLRLQGLARDFRRLAVRLEEGDAVGTERQMPTKAHLLLVGERSFDVVETEFDELLTVDHVTRPVTPAVRWSIERMVSKIIPHL